MSNNETTKASVLFVDDDDAFLQLLETALASFSRGGWKIYLTTGADNALRVLKEHPVHLAVLDINMPGVSGLDLLKVLNRDYPGLQKVFLTGLADQQTRLSGLEGGADLFLEKPANLAGLESVFATLNELVRWQQKQGARGDVRPARLLDIIKMECSSGNSRLFEVFGETARGQIFVKEGAIVHAQSDGRRGQSAFTHLASQLNAEFNLKHFVEPPERSIDRQWEFLVLEAFRTQEQLLEAAAEAKAKPAPTPAPKPAASEPTQPGATPLITVKPTEPSLPLRSSPSRVVAEPATRTTGAAPVAAPRPETPPKTSPPPAKPPRFAVPVAEEPATPEAGAALEPAEAEPIGPAVLNPTPAGLRLTTSAQPGAFRIEEMLLCSKQREVLYEWQCSQADSRVRLIEYFAEKFHQANHGLPLGTFDRLEAQAIDSRIVIQFQGDHGLLIRSNSTGQPRSEPARSHQSATQWLERGADVGGVLACGFVRPDFLPDSRAFSAEIAVARLNELWTRIAEAFEAINERRASCWLLRLIYERAQIYSVRRSDGFIFGLLLIKESELLDVQGAEQLIDQAGQLRGV